MADDLTRDESSHYEISLTAGQAFIAFVLLLLSLAAAFAFGIVIGRARGEERVVVRNEGPVVTEGVAPAEEQTRIVELDDLAPTGETSSDILEPAIDDSATETADAAGSGEVETAPAPAVPAQDPSPAPSAPAEPEPAQSGPVFVQLLSSTEARTAESLAARIIEGGFNNAYVERVSAEGGMIYRVRVRFASEAEARAAVDRLRAISRTDPWVTRQ